MILNICVNNSDSQDSKLKTQTRAQAMTDSDFFLFDHYKYIT